MFKAAAPVVSVLPARTALRALSASEVAALLNPPLTPVEAVVTLGGQPADQIAGTGSVIELEDPAGAAVARRFHRLVVTAL